MKYVIPARHSYKILSHHSADELTNLIEKFANEKNVFVKGTLRHEILDIQYAGKGDSDTRYSVLIRYNDLHKQGSVFTHEKGYEI